MVRVGGRPPGRILFGGRGAAFPVPEFPRPVDLSFEELAKAVGRIRPRRGARLDGIVGEMVRGDGGGSCLRVACGVGRSQ